MLIREKNPHGGQIYGQNIKADFSVNINPQGTPKQVIKAALESIYASQQYPDAECKMLRKYISQKENISEENIICGNGGAELIFQVAAALRPAKALIIEPTFCEYRQSVEAWGGKVKTLTLDEDFDINRQVGTIEFNISEDIDIVFLCNPNNPTGKTADINTVSRIAERCEKMGALLFIDESFGEMAENYRSFSAVGMVPERKNIFVLKSMTKTYAMPGIRLGYGLCSDKEIIDRMCSMSQCWNISLAAQKAGEAAIKDCGDYVEKTLRIIKEEKEYLKRELNEAGIRVFDSDANFMLIKAEENFKEKMLRKGILVRACDNFEGLGKEYFRIAVKNHEDNKIFTEAVRTL